MKKKDLIMLFNGLATVSNLIGVKFAYACNKNRALIFDEINSFNETIKSSPEFSQYEAERLELADKYAKKDAKGNAMSEDKIINGRNQNTFIIDDRKGFEGEFAILKEKHKTVLEDRQKQIDEYNALLEEDSNIVLFKIPVTDIPQDITVEQLQGIYLIIQD